MKKLKWIKNSIDNGDYYFSYLKTKYLEIIKSEDVQKILNDYGKKIEHLKEKLSTED